MSFGDFHVDESFQDYEINPSGDDLVDAPQLQTEAQSESRTATVVLSTPCHLTVEQLRGDQYRLTSLCPFCGFFVGPVYTRIPNQVLIMLN